MLKISFRKDRLSFTIIETNTASGYTNKNNVVVTVTPLPAALAGNDRLICLNTSTDPVSASDVASNYNVVVTGTSCSPVSTSKDATLALCIPTGMTSLAAGTSVMTITIYPNPFKSSLDIKINDATQVNNIELKIYNIMGEEVIDTNLTKQITTIAIGDLPSGIYLYKVNSNNKTIQSGELVSQK